MKPYATAFLNNLMANATISIIMTTRAKRAGHISLHIQPWVDTVRIACTAKVKYSPF